MTNTGEPIEDRPGYQYQGMSKESEEAYNKRQSEPLFVKSKDLIPMEQVKEHYDNLRCGNWKTKGCQVQKDFPNLYYCRVCMCIQSIGTEFDKDFGRITDNMLFQMRPWQHEALNARRDYSNKWQENYPRGATGAI